MYRELYRTDCKHEQYGTHGDVQLAVVNREIIARYPQNLKLREVSETRS
jgi:hypothetical protein